MVASDRVITIVSPDSAPIKRLIQDAKDAGRVIDVSCGRRTRAVIITDSEHVILSAIQSETIANRLDNGIYDDDEEEWYGKRINAVNKKIAGLKQQKIDGYIKLTKNELSEEGFLKLKQKIEYSIEECERELDSFKIEGLSAADEVAINLFEEFLDAETFTNEMLKCLIKAIYVYDDRRIEIKWNFKEKVGWFYEEK